MAYPVNKAFDLMQTAHERNRLAHAFLISGEPGCGKEELAARVIEMLNPPADDFGGGMNLFGEEEKPAETPELDSLNGELVRIVRPRSKSRRITVEDIRELEKSFFLAAAPGRWKVGVIVHADRLNENSENAFLKTLEEPPENCLLMLLTDAPGQLLPTILSRCVNLPLMPRDGEKTISEIQQQLLSTLASMSRQGVGDISQALTLRGAFSQILAAKKTTISKANDAALKEETLKYKNATDGEWLKQREDFYKAQTEAEYLIERDRLLETLITWMGDVVRIKVGSGGVEFPTEKDHAQRVADSMDLPALLQRMDALEELKANLQTNAQEQLALEVAFLTAFG